MEYHVTSGQVSSGIVLYYYDSWLNICYGSMYISSGGTANSTTVCGGVENGCEYDIFYRGCLYVFNGGTANETTINSLGYMYVSSGGTANETTMYDGDLYISSGGTANSITVNGGGLYVSAGGTALNVVWTPCVGSIIVDDGAVVTYASDYRGVYFGSDNRLLSSSLTMTGMILSSGHSMYVMNGGTANETIVNRGGNLYVGDGASATIAFNPWQNGNIYSATGASPIAEAT